MTVEEFGDGIGFDVYPNPANDHIVIEISKSSSDANVEIYSLQGCIILGQRLIYNKTEIDIRSFAPGVYFVKIWDEDKFVVKKFVKE
mgnify:CR=1 FL=1